MKEASTTASAGGLSRVFLAQIVIATIMGIVLSFVVEPVLEAAGANLIFVLFICVSISEVIMARFVVRKQLTDVRAESRLQAGILANAFSGAIAVYGLVIGVLSGNWYFVLPFGVMAFLGWRYLNQVISDAPEPALKARKRSTG